MTHTTEIKLHDGKSVTSSEDPKALAERFQTALRDGTPIEVDSDKGTVWINPHALATIGQAASRSGHFG
jgi:hypothetical protein